MKVATALLVAAATVAGAAALNECSQYGDCQDCLAHDYCGWCSPSPVIYNNGTPGTRCADQRDSPWVCDNLYQTTQCVAGYVCNATVGQCQLTTPGEGDTKAHCEAGCKQVNYFKCNWFASNATCSACTDPNEPGCQKFDTASDCQKSCKQPPELYKCDANSRTCSSCGASSYCTSDKDCPGSYCDIKGAGPWTCHGSTCQQQDKCKADCGLNPLLIGTWRGVEISASYTPGEYSVAVGASGEMVVKNPDGSEQKAMITAALGNQLTVDFGSAGVFKGIWTSWEPTAETEQIAFAYSPAGDANPPASTAKAMNGGGYTVYAMQKCKPNVGPQCNFTSAMTTNSYEVERLAAVARRSLRARTTDHCNVNKDCSACLNDPSGLCGWCDTPVVYKDGQPGAQCAGFDPDGKADPSWICKVRYRRESCFDYACDWTDPSSPTCKQLKDGTPGISKEKCELGCKVPTGVYKCNNQTFQCEKCHVEYCTSDKDCPGSYCQIDTSKPGPYICHGSEQDGCAEFGHCNSTCSAPLVGIWRGIEISHNFARGEWDFTASSDGSLRWRSPDGTVVEAQMHGGDQSAVSQGIALTLTVAGSPVAFATVTYKGIYTIDDKGNENIVDMATLAFSSTEQPTDFGMAMKDSEFVLLACDPSSAQCDFSSSRV